MVIGGGGWGGGGGMYLVVGTFCQKYVWVQVKNSSIIIYLGWSGRGGCGWGRVSIREAEMHKYYGILSVFTCFTCLLISQWSILFYCIFSILQL